MMHGDFFYGCSFQCGINEWLLTQNVKAPFLNATDIAKRVGVGRRGKCKMKQTFFFYAFFVMLILFIESIHFNSKERPAPCI